MHNHFNIHSLAKLTRSELQAIIANYTAELQCADDEQVRTEIQSKIIAARAALTLK